MQIREYRAGDEQGILELFNVVYRRKLDLGLWNWLIKENPFGEGIVRLMFDDGRLIGHYAVVPTRLCIRGKLYKAALATTKMTHPDYRRRGIFSELMSEVHACCKENEIEVVFGFPNKNSYHGFTQRLGWCGFGSVRGWTLQRGPERSPSDPELTFERLGVSDNRVDELWIRARDRDCVIVPRTSKYIEWRYYQKPGNLYTVYCVKDQTGILQGILVLKVYQTVDKTTGHIIDIITVDQPEIQKSLLIKAIDIFTETEIRNISCWIPSHSPIAFQLKALGFSQDEWPIFFGVRVIDEAFAEASFVTHSNRWWFTMGDSDVF